MRKNWIIVGLVISLISGSVYWYVSSRFGNDEKRLEEPVITGINTGYVMTWKSIPHADIYYIYVGDELVSEQAETTYVLEDIHPLNGYWLKVEAVDSDEVYESNTSLMFFSPIAYTTLNDVDPVDEDVFSLGYEQTTYANKYGLATFRFESPASTGYLVKVFADDVLYEDTIIVKSGNENRLIPFHPVKQGYTMPLDAFITSVFYLYTFEPGQQIDIHIEFLDLMDLSTQHEITIGPHQTIQFPIIQPSDAYLIGVDKDSEDVSLKLYHTLYQLEYIEFKDHVLYKPAIKTDMQMIQITNDSDSEETVHIFPLDYDEVSHQASVDIHEAQNEQYILLSGFEIFGYIFNLDFQKLKTDFDVEVYVVNRYEGLIKVDTPLEDIEANLYRIRISLEAFSDVAILIVITNQSLIDDLLEPSTFIGYIA